MHTYFILCCVCVNSVPQILHESVHDVIVERLKKAYAQVPIGDPLDGESHDLLCATRH